MTRILPHETIQNDRRIDSLDVVALVDEPTPPRLLDVIAQLDTEWTIVPGAAQAAVNFGRGKNETSPLGEGYDGVDVWCRHEYRITKIPLISKTLRKKMSRGFTRLIFYLLGV